uniref:Ig-like domain-containing protein n=1 Tax=Sinocyclocheilus anshuiensis TaxID=1608454 RepID=A0A671P1V7_9TELE
MHWIRQKPGKALEWIGRVYTGISGDEIRLDQSPAEIKRPGETVKISCKISGFTMTDYLMHWIRQKPGKALEWIGPYGQNMPGCISGSTVYYAQSLQDQFSITTDTSKNMLYLELKSLKTEDTAVYYCARQSQYDYKAQQ